MIESGLAQNNDITVTKDSGGNIVRVTEPADGPRVDAGSGCAQVNNRQALCPLGAGAEARVELKGGFNKYNGVGFPFRQTVDGSGIPSGPDVVFTGPASDTLDGGGGTDSLHSGPGIDRLNGGLGDDDLDGGPGGDTLSGGSGRDTLNYRGLIGDLTVDLTAGFARFGQPPNDIVFGDVEDVIAGLGSDTLTGDQGDNKLSGESRPVGSPPSQLPDTLTGLGGDDRIVAGGNRARDTVSCGGGGDEIELDLTDGLSPMLVDCEQIQVQAVDQHPAVTIRRRRARVAGGKILVPLRCSRKIRRSCSGRLSVRRRGGARLGRAVRYRIRRGRGRTVRVPLSRIGRRLVARRGRLRVEMTARERDPKGRPKVSVARFKLRGS